MSDYRYLPSVDKLINSLQGATWIAEFGRTLTVDIIRTTLDELRADIKAGGPLLQETAIQKKITNNLQISVMPTLVPLINAS